MENFKLTNLTPREDRRDSFEEKCQKEIIRCYCNEIESENECISFNYDRIDSVSRGKESQYLREDGTIATNNRNRNRFYDTKSFDALVTAENKHTRNYLNIYFFCKSTKGQGGYQDDAVQELGQMLNCLEKNKDNNMVVICMLEGPFWKPSLIEESRIDNKKSFHATRENLKEKLNYILRSHGLLTDKETIASVMSNEEILEALK
jgi:hypothetical protein